MLSASIEHGSHDRCKIILPFAQGVRDAVAFWLSQHDVTVPHLMEKAIYEAADAWFTRNTPEVLAAIERGVRGRATEVEAQR